MERAEQPSSVFSCGGIFDKAEIQQLCQQFTRNVTGDLAWSLENLEFEVEELQSLGESLEIKGI